MRTLRWPQRRLKNSCLMATTIALFCLMIIVARVREQSNFEAYTVKNQLVMDSTHLVRES